MKSNDKKVAADISKVYDVTTSCDDGNVHVHCKNKNTADEVVEHFGELITNDGVQEGQVCVWLGDEMINGFL